MKNVEPTPIYKLINTKTGRSIDRVTIDLDLNEYLKKKIRDTNRSRNNLDLSKSSYIRKYIDVFQFKQPYNITFFTFKNLAPFKLDDVSFYMFLDFDINGLDGFDNDLGVFDEEEGIIFQYDDTNTYAGFCSVKQPSSFEVSNSNKMLSRAKSIQLNNIIEDKPGEKTSALAWNFKTLNKGELLQIPIIISGGLSKEELLSNLKEGKKRANSLIPQVLKSINSRVRQIQDEKFLKMNETTTEEC